MIILGFKLAYGIFLGIPEMHSWVYDVEFSFTSVWIEASVI
jgi:hypothetical protein